MKSNRLTLKIFTIILLLVFSQKIGAGLFLHDWLHLQNFKESSQSKGANVVGYTCNCVDDFSMPFAENPERVSQIISSIEVEFFASEQSLIPLSSPLFHSLRGPPSFHELSL